MADDGSVQANYRFTSEKNQKTVNSLYYLQPGTHNIYLLNLVEGVFDRKELSMKIA